MSFLLPVSDRGNGKITSAWGGSESGHLKEELRMRRRRELPAEAGFAGEAGGA